MSTLVRKGRCIGLVAMVVWLVGHATMAAGPVTNVYVGPVTNNATLNWLWATQYQFTAAAPVHGSVSGSSNDWYDVSTTINLEATPDDYYTFTGWQHVPGGTSTNNPLSFALSGPYTNVTAVFAPEQYLITVHSAHGTPHPGTTNVAAFGYSQQSIAPEVVG